MRLWQSPIKAYLLTIRKCVTFLRTLGMRIACLILISTQKKKTCQVYILFWCSDIRKSRFRCKFIENTFLDGLFLYGRFGSLLNICGITIDNKILSLSHMLHDIGEKYEHMILFLKLTKRYIPLDWNTMHMMCDQAKSFESAHTAVFSKLICTCSVYPLRNVMVHI